MSFFDFKFLDKIPPRDAIITASLFFLLLGLVIGFFANSKISADEYTIPVQKTICGSIENVENVEFNVFGEVAHVECKDGREFTNF